MGGADFICSTGHSNRLGIFVVLQNQSVEVCVYFGNSFSFMYFDSSSDVFSDLYSDEGRMLIHINILGI